MQMLRELPPGTTLGGYRIEAELGRGGMGIVYRATQLALERTVALKLIAFEISRDERFRERFQREARIAASIDHPNVLPIYEAGEAERLLFLSMRYVEGGDLGTLLEQGPLAPERAVAIAAQVAEALAAAHERGLVHRDVKPSNVLLEGRGGKEYAYLADFGLAKVSASQSGLTKTGVFVGTLDYVAPEQIRGEPLDSRCDVYALGCLLYQALTGQVPYPQEDELAKLWAHMHEPPPVPSVLVAGVSHELDDVVAEAMAKEREERYASAGALGNAALAAMGQVPSILGAQGLTDLREPEHLYQLDVPGLPSRLPVLKTPGARPINLPAQPTPLVGRERELDEVTQLLRRPEVRLLTLTGPAGTGKTRLALQAAAELVEEFRDGVFFVNLAPLTKPALVPPTIAQTLALREQPGKTVLQTLAAHVAKRELLLFLDNFEQVSGAAPALAELIRATLGLKLLVTSRASLHLSGEHEYPVPPLTEAEAIVLFAERAQAAKPAFVLDGNRPLVTEICRRLDNLPLAIELAAARIKLLPEKALLQRLQEPLKLLTGGARDLDARQRTLRAAIDWSYQLLSEEEQRLFARLSVFAGGRTLEAIEAICNAEGELDVFEGISSLVDKSLLRQEADPSGEARFVMLETIQEYARERLDRSGEAEELRRRHAHHFLSLAEEAEAELSGAEQARWRTRLDAEHDNLRAGLDFLHQLGDEEGELRLACALGRFWRMRGYLNEARTSLERALAEGRVGGWLRGRALYVQARIALDQGELALARGSAEESVTTLSRLGEKRVLGSALNALGLVALEEGNYEEARKNLEQARRVAEEVADMELVGGLVCHLALLALYEEDYERAVAGSEEALDLARANQNAAAVALTLGNLGWAKLGQRKTNEAKTILADVLRASHALGIRGSLIDTLEGLAAVAVAQREGERAARLLGAAEALREEIAFALDAYSTREHERTYAALRAQLDHAALAAAWEGGRRMDLEEAVAYALEHENRAAS